MPELPEVETVRRSLAPIVGRRITGVEVFEARLRRPIAPDFVPRILGRVVERLDRRGKYLLVGLSGATCVLAHLGMSGTLLLQPAGTPRRSHDHVRFRLSGDLVLTLNDPRRFGLLRAGHPDEFSELTRVGPDPLGPGFSLDDLRQRLRHRRTPIKTLLMDQQVVGGIGNIYANEILFRAGIRPGRRAKRLTRADAVRLHAAMRAVLDTAIRRGGSSISDYRDGQGRPGYFQLELAVYDRADVPCRVCATPVRRLVHAGRSSFYCPTCQR